MADALCGPSNPLQTFQKQTSIDRTLQQDRLAARQQQAESFRSAPASSTGVLDAEFQAFQAGRPIEAGFFQPQLFSNGPHVEAFGSNINQPQVSGWASDFQHLRLNEARASPIPESQLHQHAPMERITPSAWHREFMAQERRPSGYQPQQQQMPATGRAYGYTGGLTSPSQSNLSSIAQQKQPATTFEGNFDEDAFEKAFEAARAEIQHSAKQDLRQDPAFGQEIYSGLSPEKEGWMDQNRIGSDRILDEAREREESSNGYDEAEELARTAGKLLENVRSDQSQKFQESNFLSLMRQLRDKEVRVEGDKLVDVSIATSSPWRRKLSK